MGLQEKTLELNITSEILKLGSAFFVRNYLPRDLEKFWPINRFHHLYDYATGYHINLEGKKGGYDVAIHSRVGVPRRDKALFLQFKRGCKRAFARRTDSIFNRKNGKQTAFYEFDINTNEEQHRQLRELSNKHYKGGTGSYILYAFPLFDDTDEFLAHLGRLIRRTKFITIRSLDNHARNHSPRIDLAIGKHQVRIDAERIDRCEVHSRPMTFEERDITPNVLAEIVVESIRKQLLQWRRIFPFEESDVRESFDRMMISYVWFLCEYFEIDIRSIQNELGNLKRNPLFQELRYLDRSPNNDRDVRFVSEICTKLFTLLRLSEKGQWEGELGELEFEFLLDIPIGGLEITFSDEVSMKEIEKISYILI
jgi:hypothetical protein